MDSKASMQATGRDALGFSEVRVLGSGGFGVVHEVTKVSGGDSRLYARKRIKQDDIIDMPKIMAELRSIMGLVGYKHVITVSSAYPDGEYYCIVMDVVAKSNLSTWIDKRNGNEPQQALNRDRPCEMLMAFGWMHCLAFLFFDLHEKHFCHRDIKPANFLIEEDDNILLSDFGMSFVNSTGAMAERTQTLMNRLLEYRTDEGGDIFSLGCVFLEVLKALCYSHNVSFPSEYPHAPYKKFADAVKDPAFHKTMLAIEVPQENFQCFPLGKTYAGFIKDLISYVIENMILEDKCKRAPARKVAFNLKAKMERFEIAIPDCCPPTESPWAPFQKKKVSPPERPFDQPLTFSVCTTRRLCVPPDISGSHEFLNWVPMTSTLIAGDHEAVLVNVPLTITTTEQVLTFIQWSGKTLKYVYITHPHADHYFGLSLVLKKFPHARAIATPETVAQIHVEVQRHLDGKGLWNQYFSDHVPKELVMPSTLADDEFELEGEKICVIRLSHTNTNDTSALWAPSIRLAVAGNAVYNGVYPDISESGSKALRDKWRAALDQIAVLRPWFVLGSQDSSKKSKDSPSAIQETREYLDALEEIDTKTQTVEEFYNHVLEKFPGRINPGSVWGAANVFKKQACHDQGLADSSTLPSSSNFVLSSEQKSISAQSCMSMSNYLNSRKWKSDSP